MGRSGADSKVNIKFIAGRLMLFIPTATLLALIVIKDGWIALISLIIILIVVAMLVFGIKWVVEEWPL